MANESEKNPQNPGQRQPGDPGNTAAPRKDPSQSGDVYKPQDPAKKNPGQSGGTTDHDREGSEEVEKRRAS